jgi:hypothetical protein
VGIIYGLAPLIPLAVYALRVTGVYPGGGVGFDVTPAAIGATIAIDTDAHARGAYTNVRFGVHTARRGWAEPDDVLNCRDADGLGEFLE